MLNSDSDTGMCGRLISTPQPIDTDSVIVSEPLLGLTERLAEHVHDTWAGSRIREGWKYGPKRDDELRTHPGLVPYFELSDSEKEYDRATALETIRAILALGYRIVPPDAGPVDPGA